MPTILIGRYKFRFYSSDRAEPPHMPVIREKKVAKIWLDPISVQSNDGYNQTELNRIVKLTRQNRDRLLEAWNDHFA